jgi:hypothetical protein
VLTCSLRTDLTTLALIDPPARGIYTITPRRDPHPSAAALLDQLATAFGPRRPTHAAHQPAETNVDPAALALYDGITEIPSPKPLQQE